VILSVKQRGRRACRQHLPLKVLQESGRPAADRPLEEDVGKGGATGGGGASAQAETTQPNLLFAAAKGRWTAAVVKAEQQFVLPETRARSWGGGDSRDAWLTTTATTTTTRRDCVRSLTRVSRRRTTREVVERKELAFEGSWARAS